MLSPGTYNENVLVWKPLKIQGLGPGGIIGAHELQGRDPEDPRFNVTGTVIDGRFFQQNAHRLRRHGGGPRAVRAAPTRRSTSCSAAPTSPSSPRPTTAYNIQRRDAASSTPPGSTASASMTGHGEGAGGIQLQANINNMQITNNVLENNGGVFAGGIGLGQPFAHGSHNFNVRIANNRLIGNGGLTTSGGIGIFYGSNNYEVAEQHRLLELQRGVRRRHLAHRPQPERQHPRQPDLLQRLGRLRRRHRHRVASCRSAAALGDGSGAVNVDRNLIQSNYSGDDGGGIFVLDALDQPINIRNNMIVDNVAADLGGGDHARRLLERADRQQHDRQQRRPRAPSENSPIGVPHAAGLASEANDPLFQATPAGELRRDFSNPVALFNNIFWNNDALTLEPVRPGRDAGRPGLHRLRGPRDDEQRRHVHARATPT